MSRLGTPSDDSDHAAFAGDAAAYTLGALDSDEARAYAAHLAGCAACRADVDTYHAVVARLAHAAPAVQPTPARAAALRARVLREARADVRRPLPSRAVARWALAAASLAVAASGAAAWRARGAELARGRAALAAAEAREAAAAGVAAALLGPEVHSVSLLPPGAGAGAKPPLRVYWNHTRDLFVVAAHALPPAPRGRTYQLWALARGRAPVSMGTFAVGSAGSATAVLPVPQAVRTLGLVAECALTVEPVGGAARPGEAPRLVGPWRHLD
jgi:anti-sigma-K factor RskA